MATEDTQKALAEEILEEGRRRAVSMLDAARTEAEKTVSDAKASAAADSGRMIREGAERAQKSGEMVVRTAEQEVARRKLMAREEVILAALEEGRWQLARLDGEAYRRAVAALALEAVRGMPGEAFVLAAHGMRQGEAEEIIARVTAALKAEGRDVRLTFAGDRQVASPGLAVRSEDGRLSWDNTFQARLARLGPELRRRMTPILFGDEAGDAGAPPRSEQASRETHGQR